MAFHHHTPARRKQIKKRLARMASKAKLGTGERFTALVAQLKARRVGRTERGRKLARALPGATGKIINPRALAAFIGRKKLGKARFQKLATRGRKRKV